MLSRSPLVRPKSLFCATQRRISLDRKQPRAVDRTLQSTAAAHQQATHAKGLKRYASADRADVPVGPPWHEGADLWSWYALRFQFLDRRLAYRILE